MRIKMPLLASVVFPHPSAPSMLCPSPPSSSLRQSAGIIPVIMWLYRRAGIWLSFLWNYLSCFVKHLRAIILKGYSHYCQLTAVSFLISGKAVDRCVFAWMKRRGEASFTQRGLRVYIAGSGKPKWSCRIRLIWGQFVSGTGSPQA